MVKNWNWHNQREDCHALIQVSLSNCTFVRRRRRQSQDACCKNEYAKVWLYALCFIWQRHMSSDELMQTGRKSRRESKMQIYISTRGFFSECNPLNSWTSGNRLISALIFNKVISAPQHRPLLVRLPHSILLMPNLIQRLYTFLHIVQTTLGDGSF